MICSSQTFGKRLQEILGIDGLVDRITIVCDARDVVRVLVDKLLTDDEGKEVLKLLDGYLFQETKDND